LLGRLVEPAPHATGKVPMDQNFTFPHIPEWVPLHVRDASFAEPIIAGRFRYGGALGLAIDAVQVRLIDRDGAPPTSSPCSIPPRWRTTSAGDQMGRRCSSDWPVGG
jgi:hypothetical protein